MATEKAVRFETLASGTELETPMGIGRFISYKKGNFKNQNVLVEHMPNKLKWYPVDDLRLATTQRAAVSAASDASRKSFISDFFYYAI